MRTTTRRILIPLVLLGATALATGCSTTPPGVAAENGAQQNVTTQLVNGQPIPNIAYSQMRQNLIEIETAEARGVQTTTFFFDQGVADPIRSCPSIGVPIPNTASLSNPSQISIGNFGSGNYQGGVIDQMDPNGVYEPKSSDGTYVMCVGPDGNAMATYWEGYVESEFGPAVWDPGTKSIKATGPSTFKFSTSQGH